MIKHFNAELSPCQAKGWCRRGQKCLRTGHLTADIREQWIKPTECESSNDPSAFQANKDTFCSQCQSLCNGRLSAGPEDPKEMETLNFL